MKFITIHSLKFFFRRGGVPPPPVVSVFFIVFCGLLDYNDFGDYMKTNRKPFVISLLCGVGGIVIPFIFFILYLLDPKNHISIIGGADLAITGKLMIRRFLNGIYGIPITIGIFVVLISIFCLIFNKTVVNNCNFKSAKNILGVSFCGMAAFFFLNHANAVYSALYITNVEMSKMLFSESLLYVCLIIAAVALAFLIVFIVKYIKSKIADFKIKGFILETALLLTSFIPSYYVISAIWLALRDSSFL